MAAVKINAPIIASTYNLNEIGTNAVIAAAQAAYKAIDTSAGIDTPAYNHAIAVIKEASTAAAQAAYKANETI